MITIDIVFYLPEVLSTPCGNHLCKNHVDVYATEEKMLFNGNYVRQRQLLDGCHSEINFEFLHKQYLLSSPHAESARVLLADSALTVGREKTFCRRSPSSGRLPMMYHTPEKCYFIWSRYDDEENKDNT